MAQERTLSLADLFQDGADPYALLAPLARADLTERLPDLADFVNPGTEPTAENFATWILASDVLILYFPPYQVAPYAAGPQTVTIPLADLAGSLRAEYSP
ncbi:DUF3298 domain-containing protein [bacterium]|nr:DUF3298 domain-containing protein [bacterium]